MIEKITHEGKLLALLVPDSFAEPGIHFVTPDDAPQQLAYMRHPRGHEIDPHDHVPVERTIELTHEVLILKRGKLRVDIYTDHREYLCSRTLSAGDTILLAGGGHGFEVLEEVEMIEVKQGPYLGETEKERFSAPPRPERP